MTFTSMFLCSYFLKRFLFCLLQIFNKNFTWSFIFFLSNILSYKNFLCNLSNDSIVCWSSSFCFLFLLCYCIFISYNTLSLIVNPHALELDIGIAINSIPVRDNVIDLDVVAKLKNVSNDFKFVFRVFYILQIFLDLLFFSLKYVIIS